MNIENFIKSNIKSMRSIAWGETNYDESYMVLKWGEYPLEIPIQVTEAIKSKMNMLSSYPNQMLELKNKLSNYVNLESDYITLVNGSDKAIRLIPECIINPNDEAITFFPSFPIFDSAIELCGGRLIQLPLTKQYFLPTIEEIKKTITSKTKLIYLCNPNNPTGNYIANQKIIEELLNLNIIVIIDEVYFEYGGVTYAPLLKKYKNLIILRSFSKTFGLAGLRVGYLLANPSLNKYFQVVEESIETFNISSLSLTAAIAALDAIDLYKLQINQINQTKQRIITELAKLNILTIPSFTSFLLIDLKNVKITGRQFAKLLAKEKIIIKDTSIYQGIDKYNAYLGIPKPKQVSLLIEKINKILNEFNAKNI